MKKYLSELENCELCEWRCGVDRMAGETGACQIEKPKVASKTLHPAPPESFTVFMAGCNYRCLGCQNWKIANFPDSEPPVLGTLDPEKLAEEAVRKINSVKGRKIGADRMFFSGGSPTPSLPFIEKVSEEVKKMSNVKVNYDTNGFLTPNSLERVLDISDSITFDIKAFRDEIHRAITGAPVEPVLRNARRIAEDFKDKLWEFRILLIPGINESEVADISNFLAEIDETLPVNFLAFRPNFVLENHPGASFDLMEEAVEAAKKAGLKNANWSGRTGITGKKTEKISEKYESSGARKASGMAKAAGCNHHPRSCGECKRQDDCPVKEYRPAEEH